MPTTRNYHSPAVEGQSTIRLSCSNCGNAHDLRNADGTPVAYSNHMSGGEILEDGTAVTAWLRFLPARGRYHAWCRDCERAARATASPNRRQRRGGPSRRNTERKFGVELELIFPSNVGRNTITDALNAEGLSGWRVKSDATLRATRGQRGTGWEIVSPPIQGEDGFEQLRKATRILRGLGATVNKSTGTHVHHAIDDLNIQAVKNAARGWYNNQRLIDGLVAPSRRGDAGPTYCSPLTSADVSHIESLTQLRSIRSHLGVSRYKSMNLQSYGRHGTIEIRQHQGTCDYEKIRTWILLGQAILDAAKAEAMPAQNCVRSLLDRLGDLLDETAKTFTLGRAVEFGFAPVTNAEATA